MEDYLKNIKMKTKLIGGIFFIISEYLKLVESLLVIELTLGKQNILYIVMR